MKKSKSVVLLKTFYQLERGEKVFKKSFCEENEISPRTFNRYISEIRVFLKSLGSLYQLIYIRSENSYKVIKKS